MNSKSNTSTVGIMTFQKTLNYGAILQEYALNKFLRNKDYECYTLNYQCKKVCHSESPYSFIFERDIKNIIKGILSFSYKIKKSRAFKKFEKNNIRLTTKRYNQNTISELNEVIDKFIVGSDQIWNVQLTGHDYSFFLDFVNRNEAKIAYAASWGEIDFTPSEIDRIKLLLKNFNYISLREKTGVKLCGELTNKEICSVLDPVFLLRKEEWADVEEVYPIKNKYVLVYFIHYNFKESMDKALELAKDNGLDVIYVNNTYKKCQGVKNVKYASPGQFLYLIRNAEYVVTGSFHGLSFSIIYNKKFAFEIKKNDEETRLSNLANELELNSRKINKVNIIDQIDYDRVNLLVNEKRQRSIEFLQKALL